MPAIFPKVQRLSAIKSDVDAAAMLSNQAPYSHKRIVHAFDSRLGNLCG